MYTVDRIENSIVILEDRENKTMKEVNINIFDEEIKEGDILDYINNKYIKNTSETVTKKIDILNRFNKLKK